MQNTLENRREHLHFGHLGIIAACAVILLALTVMKGGFRFSLKSSSASQPGLTYEEAKKMAVAQMGGEPESTYDPDIAQQQLAMIDPSLADGQVLGASTGLEGMMPAAETVFTDSILNQIKIREMNESGVEAVKKYADQLTAAESQFDILTLLGFLAGQDAKSLETVPAKTKEIILALAAVEVPKELAEYHRLKMIYFTTMGNVALNLAGKTGDADLDNSTTLFFSLTERLQNIQAEIYNKYSVTLQ